MSKSSKAAAGILAAAIFMAAVGAVFPAAAAKDGAAAYKDGQVVPAAQAEAARSAARQKALAEYYITRGAKLEKAIAVLKGIPAEKTGLLPGETYSYRMDKVLTGNYFYHVKAFRPGSEETAGDYLLAKDGSCVFRRFPGENRTEFLEGTTDKLLEKAEIYAAYPKIPLDGAGKIFIRIPGGIDYKLTLTSLNESVLAVDPEQRQVKGLARGKADVLAEIEVEGFSKSKKVHFTVVDERDMREEENRGSGTGIGIGIGWGWGGWHRHGGGVIIGI